MTIGGSPCWGVRVRSETVTVFPPLLSLTPAFQSRWLHVSSLSPTCLCCRFGSPHHPLVLFSSRPSLSAASPLQACRPHGCLSFALCRLMTGLTTTFLQLLHLRGLHEWRTPTSLRLSFSTRIWTVMVASMVVRLSISSALLSCLSPPLLRFFIVPYSVHLVRSLLISL